MKKWLKTLSVALLVLPALALGACDNKTNPKGNVNEDNYQVYRNVVKASQTYAGAYTLTGTNRMYNEVVRADGTELTDEEKATYIEPEELNRVVTAYNPDQHVGYNAELTYDTELTDYVLNNGTFVVSQDDKYVEYELSTGVDKGYETVGHYVDQNYAKSVFAGLNMEMPFGISFVNAYTTYDSATNHLVAAFDDELEIEGATATSLKITKQGNLYTLVVSCTVPATEDNLAVTTVSVKYTFTSERLLTVEDKIEIDTQVTATVEDEDAEPEAEPQTVTYNVKTFQLANGEFAYTYDASVVPESFTPTEDVTNRQLNVTYVLDGVNMGSHQATFGDTYTLPENIVRHNTTAKWYTDEALTQEFNASEYTYPSNDITLYGKSLANDGYAVVVYKQKTATGTEVTQVRVVLLGYNDEDTTVGVTTLGLPEGATLVSVDGAEKYDVAKNSLTAKGQAYVVVTYTVAE